ncbi:MAG TPA: amino acid adenylation domain-containing protein [Thermoanaerobaculia bacterium]|nr:amino acid adenylation domain-containing protein [Thermoanaerobaculia bacterium]
MIELASRLEGLSPGKRELLLRQLRQLKGRAEAPRPSIRPRGERRGDFPLSYAQQRLWFLDQLEPGNPFYNLPGAVRLKGPLDEAALARALSEVVRRHEALRTTFHAVAGRPVQRVGPPVELPLSRIDLSGLPSEERGAAVRRHVATEVRRSFDLTAGPLLRFQLLRLGPEERVLVFALHHIVSDAWSMRILIREVAAIYQAFSQGAPSPLPEISVQYADFAVAERSWLDAGALTPQLDYWRRRLADLPGPLELPADRPRPEIQTFRGARQEIALSATTLAALKDLGQAERATPFMALLAAFSTLLHRYTGRADLPVGTPMANRDRMETEGLIGFFVNTLVLRGDLSGDPTFRELLGRTRELTLEAFAHPDLPFERLVEELQPDRDLAHTPVFQVLFAFQSMPVETRGLEELTIEALPIEAGRALFDLTLTLEESPGWIAGFFEYNTDLFDPSRMRRMAGHFAVLLATAVHDPDQPLSALALLTAAERHQIAVEWTDTARQGSWRGRVHELFEGQAALTPDAVAVVQGRERATYRELNARANRLARVLVSTGVKAEARVGICGDRSIGMVAALLAVWKAGAAYVPMDPEYPEERLAFMLDDAGVEVLVAGPGAPEGLIRRASTVIRSEPAAAEPGGSDLGLRGGERDLAYVIYTSGSTGRPKGVAIAHASTVALLEWAAAVFPAADLTGVLGSTSICFDLSVFELFLPLVTGGAVILAENALQLPRMEAAARVSLVNTVPSAMSELVRSAGIPPSVRTVCLAGEALRRSLVDQIYRTPGVERVFNLYGPSEDTTYSTFVLVDRDDPRPPTIGRPIASTRAFVVDAHQRLLPCGVPGELRLGGEGLARGYLGRPDLTAERFVPDPFGAGGDRLYRTGDLARWSPGGELEFLGRIDHQVKVRGFRIELGEVEVALESHPAVERAVVMAGPDGQSLDAWIVASAPVSPAELRAFLRSRLPEYMVPAQLVPLDRLPMTPNGKVDRKALAGLRPRPSGTTERLPPRTPAEEILAGIWERVLGIEGIGARDNFFELGGHSLLATQVLSRVREAFAVELPLRALFESPTLAGLAERIDAAFKGAAAPPISRVPREGSLPLSFGQQRLWFLDQLDPGSVAYNMPSATRLKGPLDLGALEASLDEIVRRHEALRTVFRLTEGEEEPVQRILPAVSGLLSRSDLAALPPAAREAEARRQIDFEARLPFALSRGPLLRATLIRLSEQEHILLLVLHHAVTDGWSMGVLIREMAALYAAFAAGGPSPLAEPPVQYADYAAWQRQWLAGDVLAAQLAYWRGALAGAPPLLDLPTDRPRPPVQTFRGARRTTAFPVGAAAAVRELGRSRGITGFMVLLATFQTLLHRTSGQPVVAVGSPVANRSREEVEGLIGFFANTLVFAVDLAGEPAFRALLERVREAALGAYAHQDVPFEKLVEELAPARNLAHAPLFQVMLSFQSAAVPAASAASAATGGLVLSPVDADMAAAKFDLTLSVEERGHDFAVALDFNTDLFDPATAGRWLEQLKALLVGALAMPEERISGLPLLDAPQRAQLLIEWNDTAPVTPSRACLHELFAVQARLSPDLPAVIAPEGSLTWRELAGRVRQVAHHLRALGVGPEVLVGICMERSLDLVVGILGTLEAGGAYLPLDPAYPLERLEFMLADAGAPLVLTRESTRDRLRIEERPDGRRWICLDRDWQAIAAAPPASPSGVRPDNLAYLIYTSGSTGRPKGVALTHGNAVALLRWASGVFPAGDRAGMLASTSICFDLSVFELFLPLCYGGALVLADNALHLPRLAAASQVTLVNTVPSAIAELVRGEGLPPSVRTVVLAGEPLPRKLVDEIYGVATVGRVMNLYGPSEDTTYSTFATIARDGGFPPIGRPVGEGWIYLLDPHFQPVPVGVPGEMLLGGAGVARGYLSRPELTAERFVPDPFSGEPGARLYRTGDLARFRPDGEMLFLGRVDHQVKLRGFRIELGEIETTLRLHPGVAEALVVARGEAAELRLIAYVSGRTGEAPPVEELRAFLRGKLPSHMVPWAFVPLRAFPLNANGKIDRKALPDPERAAWGAPAELAAPRSEMELRIAAIWRDLLRLDEVGIHDNFFDSGGHSLLAVRVYNRLKRELARELPLVALFEHPTIGALARYLEAGEAEPASRRQGQDRGARRREALAARRRPDGNTENEIQEL